MTTHLSKLLAQYREGAEGTSHSAAEVAKTWHDKMHAAYKALRTTESGKEGIIGLMADPNPHVRAWAAAHSLFWVPEKARVVLNALRDENVFPYSFNSEMTLEEFDKGRLTFDY